MCVVSPEKGIEFAFYSSSPVVTWDYCAPLSLICDTIGGKGDL